MADSLLRLRAVLADHFAVVLIALVVLALLGGWLTYTAHATPNTTTEERPVSSWETQGWFNYSATVTENNSVYPVGTTLTNRSIYFAEIAPWFNGTYAFTYDASEGGDLNGTVSLQFVLRSVDENRDRTTVVWQTTSRLETVADDSFRPGETLSVPFLVNLNETMNRTELVAEELGNPPGQPEVVFRATVDFQGTVNGHPVDQAETHELTVPLEQELYRPEYPGLLTEEHERTRPVTVQQATGPIWGVGAPLLFLVSALAMLGLLGARREGWIGLSRAEAEVLAYEDDRGDFDEWISQIHLPEEAFDAPRAEAASLGALVDFAIDTDNSVIEDPDEDAYYVFHDGLLFTYQPPALRDEGSRVFRAAGEYEEAERSDGAAAVTATSDGDADSSTEPSDE